MRPRYADSRIGFFTVSRVNYGLDVQKAAEQRFIRRWRLEPKDTAAYRRGELVEPVKPIVYYLDPATPARWRPFVRQGIEDWQKVFEKAGFRNAIVARDAPSEAEDPDWDPEDIRYSVVRWAASTTRNAVGPSTSDPRTGEIIESDISWYHNHMRSYRNRLLIETGAANPLARSLPVDEALMCQAMRAVIDRCGVIAGPWQMGKVDQGFMVLWAARHLFGGGDIASFPPMRMVDRLGQRMRLRRVRRLPGGAGTAEGARRRVASRPSGSARRAPTATGRARPRRGRISSTTPSSPCARPASRSTTCGACSRPAPARTAGEGQSS